jgi:hypothetical protein
MPIKGFSCPALAWEKAIGSALSPLAKSTLEPDEQQKSWPNMHVKTPPGQTRRDQETIRKLSEDWQSSIAPLPRQRKTKEVKESQRRARNGKERDRTALEIEYWTE